MVLMHMLEDLLLMLLLQSLQLFGPMRRTCAWLSAPQTPFALLSGG